MTEVQGKVHEIIGNHLGVDPAEVKDDLYLQDDLNADQMALADIIVSLEEEFKLQIPQEDIIRFNTVGDIVSYIAENLNEL